MDKIFNLNIQKFVQHMIMMKMPVLILEKK